MTSWQDLDRAIQDEGGVVPCQNAPDMFFNTDEGDRSQYATARLLCSECPVKDLCLSYALDAGEPFGLWGGFSPPERRQMLRRRPVA